MLILTQKSIFYHQSHKNIQHKFSIFFYAQSKKHFIVLQSWL